MPIPRIITLTRWIIFFSVEILYCFFLWTASSIKQIINNILSSFCHIPFPRIITHTIWIIFFQWKSSFASFSERGSQSLRIRKSRKTNLRKFENRIFRWKFVRILLPKFRRQKWVESSQRKGKLNPKKLIPWKPLNVITLGQT
jgi:hypothetical protein